MRWVGWMYVSWCLCVNQTGVCIWPAGVVTASRFWSFSAFPFDGALAWHGMAMAAPSSRAQ